MTAKTVRRLLGRNGAGRNGVGRDRRGTALVEVAVVFPLIMTVSFSILEFGNYLYQWQLAGKASEVGVRFAVTADMVATDVPDCGVATSQSAGTPCRLVAGSDAWSVACTAGASGCNAAAFNAVAARMQAVFPRITAANVIVRYSGTGLGFVGRGAPVPDVTVSLRDLTFNWIVLNTLIGLPPIAMPAFPATLPGEDLQS